EAKEGDTDHEPHSRLDMDLHARQSIAFSSEVDTGSREENASTLGPGSFSRFNETRKRSSRVFRHRHDLRREEAMLGPEEIERYARHLVLREVGGSGQQALKTARVLVVGAGGLGAPLLLYLAAAGVGTIGVIDHDAVSLSNLQRQVIFGTPDIGKLKVD